VRLTLLALALFYMHANAYLLFVGIALGLVTVSHRWNRARLLGAARSLVYLVPSAIVAVGWAAWGALGKLSISERPSTANLPRSELLRELPLWAHDPFRSHVDEALTALLWISLLALLLVPRAPVASNARERMALVPLAIAVLTYFTLPWRMGAGVMLNVRLAVFIVLYAPLLVRPARGRWTSAALAVTAVAGILFGADATREVRAAEREEIGDLDRLLDRMPMGTRVLELPFRETSGVSHWMAWQFMGAYHRARRGGVSSYTFSDLAHWPIQFRPGAGPPRKAKFVWTLDSCLYRNAVDGPYYDFVLVRGNVDPFRDSPPGPRFTRIDTELDWNLYARVPGEGNPAWDVEDQGPCESRQSLERARDVGPKETPAEIPKNRSDETDGSRF
jgi:hypothetical protein